jgi:hypothetical protein
LFAWSGRKSRFHVSCACSGGPAGAKPGGQLRVSRETLISLSLLAAVAGCHSDAAPRHTPPAEPPANAAVAISPRARVAYCQAEASSHYGVWDGIQMSEPAAQPDGSTVVEGLVSREAKAPQKFRCRFDINGLFVGVANA